ncbi:MAG: transketolase [Bacteroidales bacterium]|nr:transketolase [Bacteroidales bacterium]
MDIPQLKLISERSRRRLIEVIYQARAGHTGGDLSCLNVLTALYFHTLNINKGKLTDPDRDRFILSKGHCVEALFVTLEAKGILEKAVLDTLGQFASPLAGHPTVNVPGIEVNSGALGHGLSIGAGMAMAAKMDGKDYKTYVLMGDGEQGEGSIYEAAMAGRQYKLDNLVAIIDRNHLQISGNTEDVMAIDDIRTKWTAFGWEVVDMDGDDMEDIVRVLDALDFKGGKPHLIISNTTKGKGVSYMENVAKWHHGVPTAEQYAQALEEIDTRINEMEIAL